jgi:hypothetical protein
MIVTFTVGQLDQNSIANLPPGRDGTKARIPRLDDLNQVVKDRRIDNAATISVDASFFVSRRRPLWLGSFRNFCWNMTWTLPRISRYGSQNPPYMVTELITTTRSTIRRRPHGRKGRILIMRFRQQRRIPRRWLVASGAPHSQHCFPTVEWIACTGADCFIAQTKESALHR